ncbi:protein kinase [Candidatus Woesearchaeota archaeon]|nr:protein kinase [Candidatus Woesearchaeota archaeon]
MTRKSNQGAARSLVETIDVEPDSLRGKVPGNVREVSAEELEALRRKGSDQSGLYGIKDVDRIGSEKDYARLSALDKQLFTYLSEESGESNSPSEVELPAGGTPVQDLMHRFVREECDGNFIEVDYGVAMESDPDARENLGSRQSSLEAFFDNITPLPAPVPEAGGLQQIEVRKAVPYGRSREEIDFRHQYCFFETVVVTLDDMGNMLFREYTPEVREELQKKRATGAGVRFRKPSAEDQQKIVENYCRQMQGLELVPLTEGGMGEVYEAGTDKDADPSLCVKKAKSGLEKELLREFRQHSKAAKGKGVPALRFGAKIIYDNEEVVASLLGADLVSTTDHDGKVGAAMTWEDYMPEASIKENLAILLEVLDILDGVHKNGVVHRDIKPQNILVENGFGARVQVADFGIARDLAEPRDGQPINGTPQYVSPQTLGGTGRVTGHDDIYACGVILHTILTGDTPFGYLGRKHGDDITALIAEMSPHMEHNRQLDSNMLAWYVNKGDLAREEYAQRVNLSDSEKKVLAKSLAYETGDESPGGRYQTGKEMADAVREMMKCMNWTRLSSKVGSTYHGNDRRMEKSPVRPVVSYVPGSNKINDRPSYESCTPWSNRRESSAPTPSYGFKRLEQDNPAGGAESSPASKYVPGLVKKALKAVGF